jgi:hypothetical protein
MIISSRTPEGESNSCPICNAHFFIEPSSPPGDAPCPQCGHLVWFDHQEPRSGLQPTSIRAKRNPGKRVPIPQIADADAWLQAVKLSKISRSDKTLADTLITGIAGVVGARAAALWLCPPAQLPVPVCSVNNWDLGTISPATRWKAIQRAWATLTPQQSEYAVDKLVQHEANVRRWFLLYVPFVNVGASAPAAVIEVAHNVRRSAGEVDTCVKFVQRAFETISAARRHQPREQIAVRPVPFVLYDAANVEMLQPFADHVAGLYEAVADPAAANPGKGTWLELTAALPRAGYRISNQPAGCVIQASDELQMKRAVEQLEMVGRRTPDGIRVPQELLTSDSRAR